MKRKLRKVLGAFVCIIFVLIIAGYWYTHPGRGPREQVNPKEKGYVEQIEGTTVLHVKGTPYEMGYQHGALLQKEVRASSASFDELLELGKRETGIPVFVFNFLLDVVYRRCAPYIPDRYKRELEGLADGAGVDLRKLRRVHVVSEVTERGCSVFAVFGNATVDGKMYHGRNFDWVMEAGMQNHPILILYEPDGLNRFASAGYVGMIGLLSGMNMDGIAMGQIGAVNKDSRSSAIPLFFLMRQVLEESHSVEDATRIIESAHRGAGYNYVVGDAKVPEARAYETCAHQCAVFTDNDPAETIEYAIPIDDAVFRADEAMAQTVRKTQTCAKGYPNMPYGSDSYDHRYKGMAMDIKASYGKINEKVALEILKAAAMRNVNLHSVLCNVTDREMWVAHAVGNEDAWKQPYIHYDLNALFLPPETRMPRAPIEVADQQKTPISFDVTLKETGPQQTS